jgi:hypothetical protein
MGPRTARVLSTRPGERPGRHGRQLAAGQNGPVPAVVALIMSAMAL